MPRCLGSSSCGLSLTANSWKVFIKLEIERNKYSIFLLGTEFLIWRANIFKCLVRSKMRRKLFIIKASAVWDHPVNLSILFTGGKENNYDSPSNGKWTGKSSMGRAHWLQKGHWVQCPVKVAALLLTSSIEWRQVVTWTIEGASPVVLWRAKGVMSCLPKSQVSWDRCLKEGDRLPLKLNIRRRDW